MWQSLIVFCIVAAAALHLCGKYLPRRWRQAGIDLLAKGGAPGARLASWLGRRDGCGGGCSSCGSCGSDDKAAAPAAESDSRRVIKLHARH